jgi:hypothetical protein
VVEIPDFDRITKLPAVPRSTGSETGYAVANPTIASTKKNESINTLVFDVNRSVDFVVSTRDFCSAPPGVTRSAFAFS